MSDCSVELNLAQRFNVLLVNADRAGLGLNDMLSLVAHYFSSGHCRLLFASKVPKPGPQYLSFICYTCKFLEWISTTKLTDSGLLIEDDEDEKDDERKNGSKRDISPIHFPKSQSPAGSVGKSHLFTLLGSVGKSHLFARYIWNKQRTQSLLFVFSQYQNWLNNEL